MYLITVLLCAAIVFSMYREGYRGQQHIEFINFFLLFNPLKIYYVHGLGESSFVSEYYCLSGVHKHPLYENDEGCSMQHSLWMTVRGCETGDGISTISMADANVVKNGGRNNHSLYFCEEEAEKELQVQLGQSRYHHNLFDDMFDDMFSCLDDYDDYAHYHGSDMYDDEPIDMSNEPMDNW